MEAIITYDLGDLQTISINDGTTYVSPATVVNIKGVRLLFQTVNSVASLDSSITTCNAWREYEVLSGTAIARGVSYGVGRKMLFAINTTPTGTWTATETGRYGQYISNVLPSSGTSWTFTPSQVGRTAISNTYFEDEIYTMDYEQYTTQYNAGNILVAGTYLVVGAEGASVIIGGTKTVYVGEVYVSLGTETFAGASKMILYSDDEAFSFATQYQSFVVYQSYLAAKAVAVAPSWQLDSDLLLVASLYASPTIAAQTDSGISLTQLQDNLDRINNYYINQLSNV